MRSWYGKLGSAIVVCSVVGHNLAIKLYKNKPVWQWCSILVIHLHLGVGQENTGAKCLGTVLSTWTDATKWWHPLWQRARDGTISLFLVHVSFHSILFLH